MKTTISPVTVQPNAVQPSAAQPSTIQPAATQHAATTTAQPVTAQPPVADDCSNHLEGCVGASVITKVDAKKPFVPFNLPTTANPIAAVSLSTS